ncbi:MAG: addiction module protein [Akkermansiaceae bacterium]|nr:addiction module protein [Akkermansiaceae bacterium]MDP4846237.1 addiction module protein [Akkermansiaceae bacterium]MDP4996542.1 addiction module protein [Akkermansiaceae bacterium]
MTINQIAPEALRLSVKERATLAASLWESIGDPNQLASDLSDEETITLALSRDAEIESGEVKPISHTELMQRLRG